MPQENVQNVDAWAPPDLLTQLRTRTALAEDSSSVPAPM